MSVTIPVVVTILYRPAGFDGSPPLFESDDSAAHPAISKATTTHPCRNTMPFIGFCISVPTRDAIQFARNFVQSKF
jgi:hypothetical protein